MISFLWWCSLCHQSLLGLSRGQAGNSWHREGIHRAAVRSPSGRSLYLHQQAFILTAFCKYTLFMLFWKTSFVWCHINHVSNCCKLIKPRFSFRAKSSRFGKAAKWQLNVVHYLESWLVSFPSDQVVMDPDGYFWQASPETGGASLKLPFSLL